MPPPPSASVAAVAAVRAMDDRMLRSRKMNPAVMFALGVGALVIVGICFFLFFPRQGGLVVAVAGPGKKQVDSVQVFVDGSKKCDTSPCVVRDLSTGNAHIVKIKAPGYANPADQPVSIKSGEDIVVNIDLSPASSGGGLKVTSEGSGQKLWVDGKEIGVLPQEVKDISPGEHSIKVGGNDRYETYEEKVTVPADEQKLVGPLKLKVLRGLAIIEPGANADGAKVILVSGSEKRALTKLPTRIDIVTEKDWKLVASKKGYVDYQAPLKFDAGMAERTFKIDLYKPGQSPNGEGSSSGGSIEDVTTPEVAAPRVASAGGTVAAAPRSGKKPGFLAGMGDSTPASTPTPAKPAPTPAKPAPAAGQGTLNVNSIPVSNVIVDGRPMGSTPKMGLSVPAGTHTVVFVHPEHGRKVVTVTVGAGQSQTAATRFP
jgi:hypothetical protein